MNSTTEGTRYWGPYQNLEDISAKEVNPPPVPPRQRKSNVRSRQNQAPPPVWDTGLPPGAWRSAVGQVPSRSSTLVPFECRAVLEYPQSVSLSNFKEQTQTSGERPGVPSTGPTTSYLAKLDDLSQQAENALRHYGLRTDAMTATASRLAELPNYSAEKLVTTSKTKSILPEFPRQEVNKSGSIPRVSKELPAIRYTAADTLQMTTRTPEGTNSEHATSDLAQALNSLDLRAAPHDCRTTRRAEGYMLNTAGRKQSMLQPRSQRDRRTKEDGFETVDLIDDESWEHIECDEDDWHVV